MLGRLLIGTRYLILISVAFILLSAIVLYALTSLSAAVAMVEAARGDWDVYSMKTVAASFLKIVDFFLICVGLQIIAVGIYKLFIDRDLVLPAAMDVQSFADLKITLVKLVGIVLLLDFVEHAFKLGPSIELMYYGFGISAVLLAVSLGADILIKNHGAGDH